MLKFWDNSEAGGQCQYWAPRSCMSGVVSDVPTLLKIGTLPGTDELLWSPRRRHPDERLLLVEMLRGFDSRRKPDQLKGLRIRDRGRVGFGQQQNGKNDEDRRNS